MRSGGEETFDDVIARSQLAATVQEDACLLRLPNICGKVTRSRETGETALSLLRWTRLPAHVTVSDGNVPNVSAASDAQISMSTCNVSTASARARGCSDGLPLIAK